MLWVFILLQGFSCLLKGVGILYAIWLRVRSSVCVCVCVCVCMAAGDDQYSGHKCSLMQNVLLDLTLLIKDSWWINKLIQYLVYLSIHPADIPLKRELGFGETLLSPSSLCCLFIGENTEECFPDPSLRPFWSPFTTGREYNNSILAAACTKCKLA